jgi:hypothetical protein
VGAVADRLWTIPLTSDFDGLEHEVTDEVFNACNDGVYVAVCGAIVRVVSVLEPAGRPHGQCRRIVAAANRRSDAPAAAAPIPEQARGRRRHGVLALLHGGRR